MEEDINSIKLEKLNSQIRHWLDKKALLDDLLAIYEDQMYQTRLLQIKIGELKDQIDQELESS